MIKDDKKIKYSKTIVDSDEYDYIISTKKIASKSSFYIYEYCSSQKKVKNSFIENAVNLKEINKISEDFDSSEFKAVCFSLFENRIFQEELGDYFRKIEEVIDSYFSVYENSIINGQSFINLLYILPSKKVQRSKVSIDNETGKFVIYYEANKRNFSSKKISIVINERDFTFSILSRKGGMAQIRGVCAFKFPVAYYKIDSLFEAFQDDGYA